MEKIIAFAKSISKPTPPRQSPYDWFYFICVAAMLGLIALVVYLSLKDSKKTLNACYVVSAALMWAGELYKQFILFRLYPTLSVWHINVIGLIKSFQGMWILYIDKAI